MKTVTNAITNEITVISATERISIGDLLEIFQDEIDYDCDKSDIIGIENELIKSQYSYIKFGMIVEKIRNGNLWNRCVEKFTSFKQFCIEKIRMNSWQCLDSIASSKVAQSLAFMGYEDLPRNASQAFVLSKLDNEQLDSVWQAVLDASEGKRHKITASMIESIAYPDKVPATASLKIPTALNNEIHREAIENNMSVAKYLENLIKGDIVADNGECTPVDVNMDDILAETLADEAEIKAMIPAPIKKKSKNFLGEIKRLAFALAELVAENIAQPILTAIYTNLESLEVTLFPEIVPSLST